MRIREGYPERKRLLPMLLQKTNCLPRDQAGGVILKGEIRRGIGKARILGRQGFPQRMGSFDAGPGAIPVHAFCCRLVGQTAMRNFAPGIEKRQIIRLGKTVILANEAKMVPGLFP